MAWYWIVLIAWVSLDIALLLVILIPYFVCEFLEKRRDKKEEASLSKLE